MPDDVPGDPVAVLVSGGIESAILCVDLARRGRRVVPLYVRSGLRWESVELASLRRFLKAVERQGIAPLVVLDEPVADIYGDHWSVAGPGVPAAESPDEAVYLPGRNLLLAVKSAIWCRLRGVETMAVGSLGSNPFPDSTPEFFRDLEGVVNRALSGRLRIVRPFARLDKAAVLRKGDGLPMELTFSCLSPVGERHCGGCNKCAERRDAFRAAGLVDPTHYAHRRSTDDEEHTRACTE